MSRKDVNAALLLTSMIASSRLTGNSHMLDDPMTIEEDFLAELAQIQTESIGWIPLDEGAYLHVGSDAPVVQVVGVAKQEMADSNVLWLH